MRCQECGREISNSELWRLAGTRAAPTARSMRDLCWDCRAKLTDAATETAMASAATHGGAQHPIREPARAS
jgi:hypothetical protein